MVANKDLKRLVRGRMQKTGESYTAARATLLKQKPTPKAEPPVPAPAPDYATLAGMGDAAIKAKTGCTWEKWVFVLDKAKAYEWEHKEIAEYVHTKYKVGDWWGQSVTVGYERIKGLRAIGQRRSGAYEASKSKTVPVPVARLFAAWHDPKLRRRWLPEPKLVVRAAQPDHSLRITWPDGTSVECWFTAKSDTKSAVAVTHTKLASKADADQRKAYWAERLGAMAEVLGSER
jgi:uncharacterized protein YndB with AHSA1/START domain